MLCEWKILGFPIISTVWLKYSHETPCIVLYVLGNKMHNVTWVEIFKNSNNFHCFVEVLTWKVWILLNVLENNVHNVRWVENLGIPDNFHSLVVVLRCNFGEELFEESLLEDDFTNSLWLFFSPLHGFFFTSSSDVSLDEDSDKD